MSADPNVVTDSFTKTMYTVATLPAAAGNQGAIQWISDSDAACNVAFNKIAVGGGTYAGRARSDGTNWRLHF
jgi:hypothetical protein